MSAMREGKQKTTGTLPTRDFFFVLDPDCIPQITDAVCKIVHGLASVDPPVHVTFAIPSDFIPYTPKEVERFGRAVKFLSGSPFVEQFTLDAQYPADAVEKLLPDDVTKQHKTLLGSADHFQADGLVTARPMFLDQERLLYQHHIITVISPDELFDFINVCAMGHSIFWTDTFVTHDMFYLETHWKLKRYKKWFFDAVARIENKDLSETVRSLIFNRFPFLLYSRDMTRFHQIQRDHYTRRGRLNRFGMAIAYHLDHFYLLLWGLLDHLTVIANHALNLNVPMKMCGIRKGRFWRACGPLCPELASVVQNLGEWIEMIAHVRHRAAHSTLPTPRPLYIQTAESSRPREEIKGIILEENRKILETAGTRSQELAEWMVDAMIDEYQLEHAELISENMVFVQIGDQYIFMDPLKKIDSDLERGFAICDAFMFACFSKHTG